MDLADEVGGNPPTVEYKVLYVYPHELEAELNDAARKGWALHSLASCGTSALVAVMSRECVTPVTDSSPEWVPTHRKDGSEVRQ